MMGRSKYNQQRILDSLFDLSKQGSGNQHFHHMRVDLVAAKHDVGFDFVNHESPSKNDINIFCDVRFEASQGQLLSNITSIRFGYDDIIEFLEFCTTVIIDPKTQIHMQVTPKVILIHEASETFPFRVELSSPDLTLATACEILPGLYPFHKFLFPETSIGTRITLFIAPAWNLIDQTMQQTPVVEQTGAYPDLSSFMDANMPQHPDVDFSNFPEQQGTPPEIAEPGVFPVRQDPYSPEATLRTLMDEAQQHVHNTSEQDEIPQAPDSTAYRFVSDDMKTAIDQRSNTSMDLTKNFLEQAMSSGKTLKDGQLVDAPVIQEPEAIAPVPDEFFASVPAEEDTPPPSYAEKDTKPFNEDPVMAALVKGMPTASEKVIDVAAEIDQQVAAIKDGVSEEETAPQAPDSTD